MVGIMCWRVASGAAFGNPLGAWELCIAIEGYVGMSTGLTELDGCDAGKSSRSGTCPPPFWK
jgi:hypothetical protein